MFGLISKKKLLKILAELGRLADPNETNDMSIPGIDGISFSCGVANAVNYICWKLKLDYFV